MTGICYYSSVFSSSASSVSTTSSASTDGVKETERSDYQTVTLLITGIDDVTTAGDDEIFYDLTGRVVANPQKGIYIMKKGNDIKKVYLK